MLNKDIRFYCVKDSSANPITYFYFDPYTRASEKRGGAWMDEVVSRSRVLSRNGTSMVACGPHVLSRVSRSRVLSNSYVYMFVLTFWVSICFEV